MKGFQPDYRHVWWAQHTTVRRSASLHEHGFDASVIKKVTGEEVESLLRGSYADTVEAQRRIVK